MNKFLGFLFASSIAFGAPGSDTLFGSSAPGSDTQTTTTHRVYVVNLSSFPLPAGGATAARQDTGNASLASIDAGIPAALGQTTMAASMPVTLASNQSALAVTGPLTDTQLRASAVPVSLASVPLPTGAATEATLALAAASLSVIDDWDETDRAKVNPIVGQAGVQAGSGVVSSNTQRVVLATDVALPTGTNSIGQVTANQPTASSLNAQIVGNVASAASDSGNPVKTGAVVNTTAPTFTNGQRSDTQADVVGSTFVNTQGRKATYSASVLNLAGANLPTDIFTITGSASKTIRILRIVYQGSASANQVVDMAVLKRSTADTGGTSTAVTATPLDSTESAATATVLAYTANPTVGTLVGVITNRKAFFNGTNNSPAEAVILTFGDLTNRPVFLRGTSEVLAVNMNGVTVTGDNYNITVEWTEE